MLPRRIVQHLYLPQHRISAILCCLAADALRCDNPEWNHFVRILEIKDTAEALSGAVVCTHHDHGPVPWLVNKIISEEQGTEVLEVLNYSSEDVASEETEGTTRCIPVHYLSTDTEVGESALDTFMHLQKEGLVHLPPTLQKGMDYRLTVLRLKALGYLAAKHLIVSTQSSPGLPNILPPDLATGVLQDFALHLKEVYEAVQQIKDHISSQSLLPANYPQLPAHQNWAPHLRPSLQTQMLPGPPQQLSDGHQPEKLVAQQLQLPPQQQPAAPQHQLVPVQQGLEAKAGTATSVTAAAAVAKDTKVTAARAVLESVAAAGIEAVEGAETGAYTVTASAKQPVAKVGLVILARSAIVTAETQTAAAETETANQPVAKLGLTIQAASAVVTAETETTAAETETATAEPEAAAVETKTAVAETGTAAAETETSAAETGALLTSLPRDAAVRSVVCKSAGDPHTAAPAQPASGEGNGVTAQPMAGGLTAAATNAVQQLVAGDLASLPGDLALLPWDLALLPGDPALPADATQARQLQLAATDASQDAAMEVMVSSFRPGTGVAAAVGVQQPAAAAPVPSTTVTAATRIDPAAAEAWHVAAMHTMVSSIADTTAAAVAAQQPAAAALVMPASVTDAVMQIEPAATDAVHAAAMRAIAMELPFAADTAAAAIDAQQPAAAAHAPSAAVTYAMLQAKPGPSDTSHAAAMDDVEGALAPDMTAGAAAVDAELPPAAPLTTIAIATQIEPPATDALHPASRQATNIQLTASTGRLQLGTSTAATASHVHQLVAASPLLPTVVTCATQLPPAVNDDLQTAAMLAVELECASNIPAAAAAAAAAAPAPAESTPAAVLAVANPTAAVAADGMAVAAAPAAMEAAVPTGKGAPPDAGGAARTIAGECLDKDGQEVVSKDAGDALPRSASKAIIESAASAQIKVVDEGAVCKDVGGTVTVGAGHSIDQEPAGAKPTATDGDAISKAAMPGSAKDEPPSSAPDSGKGKARAKLRSEAHRADPPRQHGSPATLQNAESNKLYTHHTAKHPQSRSFSTEGEEPKNSNHQQEPSRSGDAVRNRERRSETKRAFRREESRARSKDSEEQRKEEEAGRLRDDRPRPKDSKQPQDSELDGRQRDISKQLSDSRQRSDAKDQGRRWDDSHQRDAKHKADKKWDDRWHENRRQQEGHRDERRRDNNRMRDDKTRIEQPVHDSWWSDGDRGRLQDTCAPDSIQHHRSDKSNKSGKSDERDRSLTPTRDIRASEQRCQEEDHERASRSQEAPGRLLSPECSWLTNHHGGSLTPRDRRKSNMAVLAEEQPAGQRKRPAAAALQEEQPASKRPCHSPMHEDCHTMSAAEPPPFASNSVPTATVHANGHTNAQAAAPLYEPKSSTAAAPLHTLTAMPAAATAIAALLHAPSSMLATGAAPLHRPHIAPASGMLAASAAQSTHPWNPHVEALLRLLTRAQHDAPLSLHPVGTPAIPMHAPPPFPSLVKTTSCALCGPPGLEALPGCLKVWNGQMEISFEPTGLSCETFKACMHALSATEAAPQVPQELRHLKPQSMIKFDEGKHVPEKQFMKGWDGMLKGGALPSTFYIVTPLSQDDTDTLQSCAEDLRVESHISKRLIQLPSQSNPTHSFTLIMFTSASLLAQHLHLMQKLPLTCPAAVRNQLTNLAAFFALVMPHTNLAAAAGTTATTTVPDATAATSIPGLPPSLSESLPPELLATLSSALSSSRPPSGGIVGTASSSFSPNPLASLAVGLPPSTSLSPSPTSLAPGRLGSGPVSDLAVPPVPGILGGSSNTQPVPSLPQFHSNTAHLGTGPMPSHSTPMAPTHNSQHLHPTSSQPPHPYHAPPAHPSTHPGPQPHPQSQPHPPPRPLLSRPHLLWAPMHPAGLDVTPSPHLHHPQPASHPPSAHHRQHTQSPSTTHNHHAPHQHPAISVLHPSVRGPHTGPFAGSHSGPHAGSHSGPNTDPYTVSHSIVHTAPHTGSHTSCHSHPQAGSRSGLHTGSHSRPHMGSHSGPHTGHQLSPHAGSYSGPHTAPADLPPLPGHSTDTPLLQPLAIPGPQGDPWDVDQHSRSPYSGSQGVSPQLISPNAHRGFPHPALSPSPDHRWGAQCFLPQFHHHQRGPPHALQPSLSIERKVNFSAAHDSWPGSHDPHFGHYHNPRIGEWEWDHTQHTGPNASTSPASYQQRQGRDKARSSLGHPHSELSQPWAASERERDERESPHLEHRGWPTLQPSPSSPHPVPGPQAKRARHPPSATPPYKHVTSSPSSSPGPRPERIPLAPALQAHIPPAPGPHIPAPQALTLQAQLQADGPVDPSIWKDVLVEVNGPGGKGMGVIKCRQPDGSCVVQIGKLTGSGAGQKLVASGVEETMASGGFKLVRPVRHSRVRLMKPGADSGTPAGKMGKATLVSATGGTVAVKMDDGSIVATELQDVGWVVPVVPAM